MDIISVVGLVISGIAAAISVLAWKAAQKSADAAERQAVEASRAVQISQIVALHEAQLKAEENIPKVAVHLEDAYQYPCVIVPDWRMSAKEMMTAARTAPQTLDPISVNRVEFLGKLFRGILVNHDSRSVAVKADRGLFVEGITSLWGEQIGLPDASSPATSLLNPGQVALFEWFGTCTVIDWYELARMSAADAFEAETGVCVPHTIITVNHAGDEQWAPPAMKISLKFDRLPVYLSEPGSEKERPADRALFLLGLDGRGVGCDVKFQHPRVPRYFTDLMQSRPQRL